MLSYKKWGGAIGYQGGSAILSLHHNPLIQVKYGCLSNFFIEVSRSYECYMKILKSEGKLVISVKTLNFLHEPETKQFLERDCSAPKSLINGH